MATKEKRLKKEAMDSAKWRGHLFSGAWWVGNNKTFGRKCAMCGAIVVVNLKPAPNEIDIGGEAVALNCPKTLSQPEFNIIKTLLRKTWDYVGDDFEGVATRDVVWEISVDRADMYCKTELERSLLRKLYDLPHVYKNKLKVQIFPYSLYEGGRP